MELKEKMKFVRAWDKLCRLQKRLNRLDSECCGATRGEYTVFLTCDDDGKWVRTYKNEFTGRDYLYVLRGNPYKKVLEQIQETCKSEGLYYFHQTDPRGVSLWISDKALNYANYTSEGYPCI